MPDPDSTATHKRGSDAEPGPACPADIRFAAMNLLARREHSLAEMRHKLRRRFADEAAVEAALQKLVAENLQSDERYAESFARQRATRGYGPLRVRQEMRDKGLSDQAISEALEAAELDWAALAAQVLHKKFGRQGCADIKERARRVRFMQYRGFSTEHYKALIQD